MCFVFGYKAREKYVGSVQIASQIGCCLSSKFTCVRCGRSSSAGVHCKDKYGRGFRVGIGNDLGFIAWIEIDLVFMAGRPGVRVAIRFYYSLVWGST